MKIIRQDGKIVMYRHWLRWYFAVNSSASIIDGNFIQQPYWWERDKNEHA